MKQHFLNEIVNNLIKISQYSDMNYKHAAAIIIGDKYISGYNKRVNKKYSIHAEIDAIYSYDIKDTKNKDIIVIRTRKQNILGNSRPCNKCIDKMKKMGIRKVYYSNDYGNIICEYVEYMEYLHLCSMDRRWAEMV